MGKHLQDLVSAGGRRARPTPAYLRTAIVLAVVILVVVMLLVNLFTTVFSVVQYYGDGMEPALQDREILVIRKTDRVEEGDIIVFYYNNKALVRRVICTGGSMIQMDDRGAVTVDNEPLEEPYVEQLSLGQCTIAFPYSVPVNHCFVMGDNRAIAMDSRLTEIGAISTDRILGKVVLVI